jgi:hypothetical protein
MNWLTMFRNRPREYQRIPDTTSDSLEEELLSSQFEVPRRPFPRKEIIAGVLMLLLGLFLVTLGVLVHIEHWDNDVPGTIQACVTDTTCCATPGNSIFARSAPFEVNRCRDFRPTGTCLRWTAGSAAGFAGLGLLVLIPGAYASTIAAGAWMKAPGFSFEMMPSMARPP